MKDRIKIRQSTKIGYIEMDNGGVADLCHPGCKSRRGRVQENGWICPTITCSSGIHHIIREVKTEMAGRKLVKKIVYFIRRLTPEECFAIMGLKKEYVKKAQNLGVSDSSLYKQAGNGIIADCTELIMEHVVRSYYDGNYVCSDTLIRQRQGITADILDKALYESEEPKKNPEFVQLSLDDILPL